MHLFFLILIITIDSNVFAQNCYPYYYYDFMVAGYIHVTKNKKKRTTFEKKIIIFI